MKTFSSIDLEKMLPYEWPKGWTGQLIPAENENSVCLKLRKKKFSLIGSSQDGLTLTLSDLGTANEVQQKLSEAMKPSPIEGAMPQKTTREIFEDEELKIYWISTPDLTDIKQARRKVRALLGHGRLLASLEGTSDEVMSEEACDLLSLIDFEINIEPSIEKGQSQNSDFSNLSAKIEEKISSIGGMASGKAAPEKPESDPDALMKLLEEKIGKVASGSKPQHNPMQDKEEFACTHCGEYVPKGRFCSNCGTEMVEKEKKCNQCSATLPSNAKFCLECGSKTD